jgi:hypothetical protein
LETKIGNLKKFFTPYHTRTYGENGVYNFVDFRIKRAGSSNYGGRLFFGPQPKRRKIKIQNAKRKISMQKSKILLVSQH